MTEIFRTPYMQLETSAGVPVSGAKLNFYQAGTATRITTYQDSGKVTPHANPVVADASGRFAAIYVDESSNYKIVLTDANDVTLQTFDNINPVTSSDEVSDNVFRILGNLDATKKVAFQVDGLTTATTRTLTVADKNGTIALENANTEAIADAGLSVFSGFLYGLTLANNATDATNDIDVAAGTCIDSTNAVFMTLGATTKQLDAGWAAGSAAGFRNSGAAITDTTYHIYAVSKAAGADPDYYAHTSTTVATVITALQAESGGADYLYARRIGSIIRSGGVITPFTQRGDEFLIKSIALNVNTSALSTTATNFALPVPTGIQVTAMCNLSIFHGTAIRYVLVYSPDQTDIAASSGANTLFCSSGFAWSYGLIRTDTSGNVRAVSSGASTTFELRVNGWLDTRGRAF